MKVTESALKQFKQSIDQNETPGSGIRLFTSQGCCGPSIQMSVVVNPGAGDKILTFGDVDFFVEPQAEQKLTDISIDYRDDSFKLDGMKKASSCCG
jgi:Fe-S cluster assembly iron-binding protein IscA